MRCRIGRWDELLFQGNLPDITDILIRVLSKRRVSGTNLKNPVSVCVHVWKIDGYTPGIFTQKENAHCAKPWVVSKWFPESTTTGCVCTK